MAALAGSWTTLAMGFAGMRVEGDTLCFDPVDIPGLPEYGFSITYRGAPVEVTVSGATARVSVRGDHAVQIRIAGVDVATSSEIQSARATVS